VENQELSQRQNPAFLWWRAIFITAMAMLFLYGSGQLISTYRNRKVKEFAYDPLTDKPYEYYTRSVEHWTDVHTMGLLYAITAAWCLIDRKNKLPRYLVGLATLYQLYLFILLLRKNYLSRQDLFIPCLINFILFVFYPAEKNNAGTNLPKQNYF
jgi:hypothetical protein